MYKQINKNNNTGIKKEEFLPGFSYGDGVRFDFGDEVNLMMEPMARLLNELIIEKNFSSVLDIGSGSGALAYYLRKLNPSLSVVTIDGNLDTIESPFIEEGHHFICRTDQDYEIVDNDGNTAKFDLIVSFEHLEHIQESNFSKFMENIKIHSHKKTFFIATAAKWEYENEDEKHIHCNVKNINEWNQYFQENSPFVSEELALRHSIYDFGNMAEAVQRGVASFDPLQAYKSDESWLMMRFFDYFCIKPGHNIDENLREYTLKNNIKVESWYHRMISSVMIVIGG